MLRAAFKTTQRVLIRDLIPFIIAHLGNPEISEPASQALISHGEGILGTLGDYLNDRAIPLKIRSKLPSIFPEVGSEKGVRDLIANLDQDDPTIRYAIIKALNKLKTENPKLRIREAVIRRAILREVGEAYVLLGGGRLPASQADPGQGGHEAPSEEEQGRQYRQAIHRIFRLLELLYTPQDIRNTYRGLNLRRSKEVRASSIEFLDNLLPSGLKKWILPLVDDSMPVEEKLKIGNSFVG